MAELGCFAATSRYRSNAPADQWRVAQRTGIAQRCRRDSRVAFSLVSLGETRESDSGRPKGGSKAFASALKHTAVNR